MKITFSQARNFLTANKKLLFVLLFLLQIIVLIALTVKNQPFTTGDTPHYLDLSNSLASGRYGVMTDNGFEPEGVRVIGYPFFIFICHVFLGSSNFAVVCVQSILFLWSVFLIYKVVKNHFGENTSVVFLIIAAIYPFVAFSASQISPESVCGFILALAVFVLDYFLRREKILTAYFFLGFLLAISGYFRPNLLPLPIFLAIIFFAANVKNWKPISVFLLAWAIWVIPLSVYNYINFSKIAPTPAYSGAGNSLFLASWQGRVSISSLIQYGMYNKINEEVSSSGMIGQINQANRQIGVPEDVPPMNMLNYSDNAKREAAQNEYGRLALENIKSYPVEYLKMTAENTVRMWFPTYSLGSVSGLIGYPLLISGVSMFLLGIIGFCFYLANFSLLKSPVFLTISGSIIFHVVTLSWLHTEARYTIPVRLYLLIFASYAVTKIARIFIRYLSDDEKYAGSLA